MNQKISSSPTAVVLVSGGLDSATALAIAQSQGLTCHALSFDYGQRNKVELLAAEKVAKAAKVTEHKWAKIDLRVFGGSALTDAIDVPKNRNQNQMESSIPDTYVPARNTIFLSYALAMAEVIKSQHIFIGIHAVDYSGYPDCRPEFIAAYQAMANLATKAGVQGQGPTIHTPLIHWDKTQIIKKGLALGVDYSMTHSCYDPTPQGKPCGHCDACVLRQNGFAQLGMSDPALTD